MIFVPKQAFVYKVSFEMSEYTGDTGDTGNTGDITGLGILRLLDTIKTIFIIQLAVSYLITYLLRKTSLPIFTFKVPML